MPRKKHETKQPTAVPEVRVARPSSRAYQLRYLEATTGREIRISTGSRDEAHAQRQRKELEDRLVLGLGPTVKAATILGPKMKWEDFRKQFRTVQLVTLDTLSPVHAESRLDIAERILKPRTLGDIANSEALHRLQAQLLAGAQSRYERRRSPHTVRSYMAAILAAVNWAYFLGWIPELPKFRRMKVAKFKAMKGRPITEDEFKQMLAAVERVVGPATAPAWKHVLRGLWNSAFRLDELMNMSWDNPHKIRPEWREGRHGSIHIRMEDAGVPPTLIARVLRHQSWDTTRKHYVPGDVQKDAAKLKMLLDVPTATDSNTSGEVVNRGYTQPRT